MSNRQTAKQRNAIHLWFEQVEDHLNSQGIDKIIVIDALKTRGLDVQWSGASFKNDVYKPVYYKVSSQDSTEDATSSDHDTCYNGLIKYFEEVEEYEKCTNLQKLKTMLFLNTPNDES